MERAISTTAAVEVWHPIAGYEGLYEVSSLGQVRSLDRYVDTVTVLGEPSQRFSKGRILKLNDNTYGYMHVILNKDGIAVNKLVHRLVAQAFIPNPDNLPIINHKDLNTCNNRVENLEWCDYHYNNTYADAGKRRADYRRIAVEQLTMDGQHVAYYLGIRPLCRNANIDMRSIQRCLQGRNKSAYGYRWRYADVSKYDVQFATDTSLIQYKPKDTTIEQLTMDGQHVAYFQSLSQAAKAVSCAIQNIHRAVHKCQAAKGYRWRYVNNPGKEETTHT